MTAHTRGLASELTCRGASTTGVMLVTSMAAFTTAFAYVGPQGQLRESRARRSFELLKTAPVGRGTRFA